MLPITEDQIAANLLSLKWENVKKARTAEDKAESEFQITQFFQRRLQATPTGSSSTTFLAPIHHLQETDADKIKIYEIGARILFGSVCLGSTQKEVQEAIHLKMQGAKSIDRLAKELNTAFESLALLPESEKTSSMISKVMAFFSGLEGRFLDNILKELKEFPKELRGDYFQFRRTKDLVDALNQIKTDKTEALKTLIPTMKALTEDFRRQKFMYVLKLIPEGQREASLKKIAEIAQRIPKDDQLNALIALLEHKIKPQERSAFLLRIDTSLLEKNSEEFLSALEVCVSCINLNATAPITLHRVGLLKQFAEIMMEGDPSEATPLAESIKEIPDSEIDECCRDVIRHSNRFTVVYYRQMIIELYTKFPNENRSEAVDMLFNLVDTLNIQSKIDFSPLMVLLLSISGGQRFPILPYIAQLYQGYISKDDSASHITSELLSLTTATLHSKEQMIEVIKAVVRLRTDLRTHPATLISAVRLLSSDQIKVCTIQNVLLQAYISILDGVSLEWRFRLIEGISKLSKDAILDLGPLCKSIASAGARLNLLGICAHFPPHICSLALEKYTEWTNLALFKNTSLYLFTHFIYKNYLGKVSEFERLEAINHIGTLLDDEEYASMPESSWNSSESAANPELLNVMAEISSMMLRQVPMTAVQVNSSRQNQHPVIEILNKISLQHIGKVFKYTSLLCKDLPRNKFKILQAACKVPAEDLKDIVECILPFRDKLNASDRVKWIEELAKTSSSLRTEKVKALADPMKSPSMR